MGGHVVLAHGLEPVGPLPVRVGLLLLQAGSLGVPVHFDLQLRRLLRFLGRPQLEMARLLLLVDDLLLELADPIVEARYIARQRNRSRLAGGGPGRVVEVGGGVDVAVVLFDLLLELGDLRQDPLTLFPEEGRLVAQLLDPGVEAGGALLGAR